MQNSSSASTPLRPLPGLSPIPVFQPQNSSSRGSNSTSTSLGPPPGLSPIPAYQPFTNYPTPTPFLPNPQTQLPHSPSDDARHSSRATIRANWIRTRAANIARLSRETTAAEQRLGISHSRQDFENWKRLSMELAAAMDLASVQGERRQLFMPEGMRALRTGVEADRSRAFEGSEETLLGWEMALMERVGAEVRSREEQPGERGEESEVRVGEEDEVLTKKVLATLSTEEKWMLRHALRRRMLR